MRDWENEFSINIWHDDYIIKNHNKNNRLWRIFNQTKKNFIEYFDIIEIKFYILNLFL